MILELIKETLARKMTAWKAEHPGQEMDVETWRALALEANDEAYRIVAATTFCSVCHEPIGRDEESLVRKNGFVHPACWELQQRQLDVEASRPTESAPPADTRQLSFDVAEPNFDGEDRP
jgi:hypothetical protein